MNIDRVWLAECWVSCRAAVFSLPNCPNVLNTCHYNDSVKHRSPSAGGQPDSLSVVGVLWQRFGKSLSEHTCM